MKDGFDKAKAVAQIMALVAIPVLLAVGGWFIQSSSKNNEIRRDYVQLAIAVLSSPQSSPDIRAWATEVLSVYSPVAMGESQRKALLSGKTILWSTYRPALPSNLKEPCPPIPLLETESWDDVALAYMDLTVMYGICAARHRAVVRAYK